MRKKYTKGEMKMTDLYIDFDGVIKDTIKVSYKMMEEQGISLSDRPRVIKFYQDIDWNKEIKVELTPGQQKVEDEINDSKSKLYKK